MPEANRPGATAAVLRDAEIDPRMLGMLAALAGIWCGLDAATDGVFLSARNLYNLAVQTSVVGLMAAGMVFVIVARHIDLSVGSVLGFAGMAVAVLQAEVFSPDTAYGWPLALMLGLLLGVGIGAWQGWWVAYRGVPAFVVTLAGLLIFRGGAYLLTDGRTVAPLAPGFTKLGGGLDGSIGTTPSLLLAGIAILSVVALRVRDRASRERHGVTPLPLWADVLRGGLAVVAIATFVAVMNAAPQPRSELGRGVPIPVLILIVSTLGMTAIAKVTRFGRYVFAMGGNPEAAALSGVDTKRVTVGVFALMGGLAALAGAVTTARLAAGTNSMGTLAELNTIAAAVIGGTSLAGGVGSVPGALLGAVVMQSLENGMVLLGVSSALRQVLIGLVLIGAVWLDSVVRARREAT